MLSNDDLRSVLLNTKVSIKDKLLLILYANFGTPKTGTEIKRIAMSLGIAEAASWNTSYYFQSVKRLVLRTREGYVLTTYGRDFVLASGLIGASAQNIVISDVRKHLALITDAATVSFIEEAIFCFENKLFRAAVVLSWVGAVSVLYRYVIQNRLTDFNAEATRRNPKWKAASTPDDLARMKESDFLDTLDYLSIIGKSVKRELQNCLDLRNGCGHPNSLIVGESKLVAHLETLIDNVFAKFV